MDQVEAVKGTALENDTATAQDIALEEEIPAPPSSAKRQSFGWTREQDNIILNAVSQPGANPEDPAFWTRFALTVLYPHPTLRCSY